MIAAVQPVLVDAGGCLQKVLLLFKQVDVMSAASGVDGCGGTEDPAANDSDTLHIIDQG